jgi:hypothetical protein
MRQKLSSEGITNFESDERFKRLTECKMDDYYDENQCATLNNPEPAYQRPSASGTSRPKSTYTRRKGKNTQEKKEKVREKTRKAKEKEKEKKAVAKEKEKKQKAVAKEKEKKAAAKEKEKEKKQKAETKASSTKKTTQRCPNGTRKNKKTGECEKY